MITNVLISLFGFVILGATILISWQIWLASADNLYVTDPSFTVSYPQPKFNLASDIPKTYVIRKNVPDINGVMRDFLEVYDKTTVDAALGNNTKQPPTYAINFQVGGTTHRMAILPLTSYDYSKNGGASLDSATYKLLTYAESVATTDQASEIDTARTKYGDAASPTTLTNASVYVRPSVNSVPADGKTVVPIKISINPSRIDSKLINHVSVFATTSATTFTPTVDDAGKQAICTDANTKPPTAPLSNLLGETTCDASGNCGSVNFTAPSSTGAHQIFAVAMKSNTKTACASANVLGWSVLDGSQLINVYKGVVESGADLTVSFNNPVTVGTQFLVRVQSTNPKIDHVSLFVAKTGDGGYDSIDNAGICKAANANDATTSCTLCLHGIADFSAGVRDQAIPVTLDQSGEHRIIAVGVSDKNPCSAADPASSVVGNLVTVNKEGVVSAVSATDITGTGKTDATGNAGSGGGSGTSVDTGSGYVKPGWATSLAKSVSITNIETLLKKLGPFTLYILGFLAVLAIIIAGMKYISSSGDQKKSESGKKALLYSVYGIIATVLCVELVQLTISEVQKIVGNKLDTSALNPNSGTGLLSGMGGGPNASVMDIIGHKDPPYGFIWQVITLAVYYAEFVAVFYILYASFLYITSFGDDSKAESAKKTIIWAVIGMAFIISANVLLGIFGNVLS